MTAFFQAAMAIAFVALGSWALWMHRPVDGTLFSIVVIILAVAQRTLRRRRRRLQTSSTSRP